MAEGSTGGRIPEAATLLTCLAAAIWVGLVVGVSFVATPIKFTAPTLELKPAIDVGRVTFTLLNQIEWWFAAVLFVLALFAYRSLGRLLLVLVAVAIVLIQTFWLLPVLEARSIAFVAGEPTAPSFHHLLFGVVEMLKVLVLFLAAILYGRAGRQAP